MATTTVKQPNSETDQALIKPTSKIITIKPTNFQEASFKLIGWPDVPLVIHRFSAKTKLEMKNKMETGKAASSKKDRPAKSVQKSFEEARYRDRDGHDGFHAGSLRNAAISACRLVGFKMVLAKLSIFVVKDGVDVQEPQIPLIRIHGEPTLQEDMARVETGQPYVTVRPAFWDWWAVARMRWDADQFTLEDVTNLLVRVGAQVGIGEGRPDSPNSAGMCWGLFSVEAANGSSNH